MQEQLHIQDVVVTSELLERSHSGQSHLVLGPKSVLTPSGWDYVRANGLEVVRGTGDESRGTQAPPEDRARPIPDAPLGIREVLPTIAEDHRIVVEGRCEHPDRSCGCRSEEFGSGFVEPDDCEDCTVRRIQTEGPKAPCDGCNRQLEEPADKGPDAATIDTLVQVITDQVVARLRETE